MFHPPPRLSLLSLMGYFKLSISFLKYLPQMYWNWKRKSTKGWSILNILLDFTGGFFSFVQLGMESSNGLHLNINPVKLALSIICMIYDIIFIVQHYFLYADSGKGNNAIEVQNEKITERAKLSIDQNV